ncbi:hypothetical protein Q3Y64_03450 [Uliginosibacterium sp. 31-12]|nr:hypothetical protein [Uliginosibacterium sp. 31-12]
MTLALARHRREDSQSGKLTHSTIRITSCVFFPLAEGKTPTKGVEGLRGELQTASSSRFPTLVRLFGISRTAWSILS